MRIVGLTGGIATGKSTVVSLLRDFGFPVIDCDVIAREVVNPGRWGWKRLVHAFGRTILKANGEVDRELLANMIYADARLRKKLNAATHVPVFVELVKRLVIAWMSHVSIIIVDMPLMFETGAEKWFSPVVLVWCDEEQQVKRLMERDQCNEETAKMKVHAQMSMELKAERATLLINNSLSKANTKVDVRTFAMVLKRERIASYFYTPIGLVLNLLLVFYLVRFAKSYITM